MHRMVLTLVPPGPGESCKWFQKKLLPLCCLWSLILHRAREIFPNKSFTEIVFCCMEKLQFWWISNFWWKIFCLKIPKKLRLWPWSGCLPPSALPGFMAHSHGLLFYSKRSCWMSFWLCFWAGKQIGVVRLSKLPWFNRSPCCGAGGLPVWGWLGSGAISCFTCSGECSCRSISSPISCLMGNKSGGYTMSLQCIFWRILACLFMLWTCHDCGSGSK